MNRRITGSLCFALLAGYCAFAQTSKPTVPLPDEVVIGRHSFIDIGPPFDFYEVITLRSTNSGIRVERALLSPPGDKCLQPASVEGAEATIAGSMSDVLEHVNPCAIPEKELQREVKRCKKCLVFSGADVTMQLQCGGTLRSIRTDILDRDMFDDHPNTPKNTSWSMNLMARLDKALGSNVLDKPIFAVPDSPKNAQAESHLDILTDVSAGKYDTLFASKLDKPSKLFEDAKSRPPTPSVVLLSSTPFQPINPSLPKYPPIAKAAKVNGSVALNFDVTSDGKTSNLNFLSGSELFRSPLADAVATWSFPSEAAGKTIQVSVGFNMNCPVEHPH